MPQEKLSNLLQQKLEQLKAIPDGVDFNPSSAWQKMEERLHIKNKTYRISRYVVAASIVVISGFVWLVKDGKRTDHQNFMSHQPISVKMQKTLLAVILKKDAALRVPLKKQIPPLTSITDKFKHLKNRKYDYYIATVKNAEQVKTPEIPLLKDTTITIIKPEAAVVTNLSRKKLRIVHNNEIEQSIETARRNTTANIRFQIFKTSQYVFPNTDEEKAASLPLSTKGFIQAIITTFKED